jgi:hypothetical protein
VPDIKEQYLDQSAEQAVDLEENVDEKSTDSGEIYIRCLESPELRNDGIAAWTVGYNMELMASETGNQELAEAYWTEVAEFLDMSWSDIYSVPQSERGPTWHEGTKLVSAVCQRQAFIESGLAYESMVHGANAAVESQKMFDKLSKSEAKAVATENNKAERMKQKRTERAATPATPS